MNATGTGRARRVERPVERVVDRTVPHTTPRALVECAGLPVAVPQFEPEPLRVPPVAECGPLRLTLGQLTDTRSGRRVSVTVREMQILALLMGARGAVVTREQMAKRPSNAIDAQIVLLRRKLIDLMTEARIVTHVGFGYALDVGRAAEEAA